MSQPTAIAKPAAGSPIAGWAEDPQGGLQLTGAEPPLTREEQDVLELVHRFAAQVLKGTGLQAVPQEDGKAVVLYLCWEYRQTDIGPYNEVAVTVLAVAPGDPHPAIYVADLPVTTEAANRAGQELWGYNKFVTNIEIKGDGKHFSAIVHDPQNGLISSLEGTRGVSVPVAPNDLYSFSLLEKKIIKTFVQVPTPWHASGGEGFRLRVGDSTHRMAGHLRTLGLDGARPALVQYADPFQSLLFPGTAL